MSRRFARFLNDERGRVGPVVLLAITGLAIGAPLGFLGGALVARVFCASGDGSLGGGESCGMAVILFSLVGIPIGALIGAIVGGYIGSGRRRRHGEQEAPNGVQSGEPEAPLSAWLTIAGGTAIAFGVFKGWRNVYGTADQVDRIRTAMSSDPEPIAFVGGLLVLLGGILRVLRPAAPVPAALIGAGAVFASAGIIWGLVEFLQVSDDLTKRLFLGAWLSLAGSAFAVAGLLTDRPAKDLWHRWRRVATA